MSFAISETSCAPQGDECTRQFSIVYHTPAGKANICLKVFSGQNAEKTAPRFSGGRSAFFSAEDEQHQGQDQEQGADPLGGPGQLGVHGLGLVLGQEGVGHAADGAGEAGALAGLEQHDQDDAQPAEELQNSDSEFQDVLPPNELTRCVKHI